MNIRAELQSLKSNYEQSLQLYEKTKKTQYYLIYQNSLRDYFWFIEQHQLKTSDVDEMVFSDLLNELDETEQKKSSKRKNKQSNRPPYKNMIVNILQQDRRPMTAKEIAARCSLTLSPTNKYLMILEKEKRIHHTVSPKGTGNAYLWSAV